MIISNYLIVGGLAMLTMIGLITPMWKKKDPAGIKKRRKLLYAHIALGGIALVCGIIERTQAIQSMGVPNFGEFIYTAGLGIVLGMIAAIFCLKTL